MIMLAYYKTGKPPFEKVYLHGLVRDKDRQKMSKSKGNVIDPLGVIDTYGTDALRFALVFSTAAGNDIPLSEDKIRGMKFFANKIWNVARFVLTQQATNEGETDETDQKMLEHVSYLTAEVTKHLENFRLHEAAQLVYDSLWHEFADKYIEYAKNNMNTAKLNVLKECLETYLKLLHPFMPFVTETIWQLNHKDLLMVQKWPKKE